MAVKTGKKKKKKDTQPEGNQVDVPVTTETEDKAPFKPNKLAGEKKGKVIKDTSDQLPEVIKQRKIVCREVGDVGLSRIDLQDITATAKSMYVDDIHHANPHILQTIYWIMAPSTKHVVARVTEEEYEYVLSKLKKIQHHVTVVDCSVIPTLSYGSWKVSEIKGELPTAAQIEQEDEEFRKNVTSFHNPPVKLDIYESAKREEEAAAEELEDDDELELDLEEEEDDDEEFDFGEDDED